MKTFAELTAMPPLTIEQERVIMTAPGDEGDGLPDSVIHDQFGYGHPELEAAEALFKEHFEVIPGFHFADPNEDYYQGVARMTVIRRKSDGALFGYQWWTPIAKNYEPYIESNGDEHGFELDISSPVADWDAVPNIFVWTPVEAFTITGYKHTGEK